MALTNAFYEAVRTSNIRSIRIMMKDSLLVDPSFAEFSEMEKAAAAVEGLYDVHDNRPFDEDPNHWNDAYMNRIMVQLVTNFSHERINHAKAVVRKLRPVSAKARTEKSSSSTKRTASNNQGTQKQTQTSQLTLVIAGIAGGGVAGCIISAIADFSIIGGVLIGAAVGGCGLAAVAMMSGGK